MNTSGTRIFAGVSGFGARSGSRAAGSCRGDAATSAMTPQRRADLAASFQGAAVDVLVGKSRQAVDQLGYDRLCVGGGVAANSLLRRRLVAMAEETGIELVVAPIEYCTDNAAMAALGWELLERGCIAELDLDVTPGLVRKRAQASGGLPSPGNAD